MRKLTYIFALLAGFVLASCSNDDIPVESPTVIRVNPSTVMSPFTFQINPGDLDGVGDYKSLRIRLYVYDEEGNLYTSEQQDIRNYLSSATFNLNLNSGATYTAIAISDVTDSQEGNVPEYWVVSGEQDINTLQITYAGSDTNYGSQEILGVSSTTVQSGNDLSINLEPAGALVCTNVYNLHAYSNVSRILLWGSRGNGHFDFSNYGELNSNPDLDMMPYFLDVTVGEVSDNGRYTYKFLMPQTNYDVRVRFFDANDEILGTGGDDNLTIDRGHEYWYFVKLDPNDNGDGTFSVKFEDKTYKTYDSSLLLGANVAKAKAVSGRIVSNCKIGKAEADKKSYSVKDLLKQN